MYKHSTITENGAWTPPKLAAPPPSLVTELATPSQRQPPGITKFLEQLFSTSLLKFYRAHLKKIKLLRFVFLAVWDFGLATVLKLHSKYINREKTYSIAALKSYIQRHHCPVRVIAQPEQVTTPPPDVVPKSEASYLISPHDEYVFPELYVATIENAVVTGGSNLVTTGHKAICHDLYDFRRDNTSEELHLRVYISPRMKRLKWLFPDKSPLHLPVAATFVDGCALNYVHWMTEVLPRIALFCSVEEYKDVPIIVNSGLHQNIVESIYFIAGPNRRVLILPLGRDLLVQKLYMTSVTGYIPFGWRNDEYNTTPEYHGQFSPTALGLIRERMLAYASSAPATAWPKKIYIRRNSAARKITNAAALEYALVAQGFTIVEPESMTFAQQVLLFANATVIVGSSGAALGNIVFAPTRAKIYILIGKHRDASYWYWQNIARACGNTVHYVFCRVKPSLQPARHSDITVGLDTFLQEIRELP